MSHASPFVKSYACPACGKILPTLDKLNFHLSYACSSRFTETNNHEESVKVLPSSTSSKVTRATKDDETDPENVVSLLEEEDDSPSKQAAKKVLPPTSSSLVVKPQKAQVVDCPGCGRRMPVTDLDFHLDKACLSRALRPVVELAEAERKPPGLVLLENFVTEDEEAHLVSILEGTNDWKLSKRNGRCDTKHWGIVIDYSAAKFRTRHPDPAAGEKEMPEFLNFIMERFAKYPPLAAWWPNEANANRYLKDDGHFLTPHFDDRQLSGEIICNVNLLSDCIMTFAKPGSIGTPFKVRLPRLSASVMSRSARYDFTHAITNEDLLGPKRISINFRQQSPPLTGKPLHASSKQTNDDQ